MQKECVNGDRQIPIQIPKNINIISRVSNPPPNMTRLVYPNDSPLPAACQC